VVSLASAGSKGSESRGARADEKVAGVVFASASDPLTQAEVSLGLVAGALGVMLWGPSGVIDRANVCGLLIECLQDVSFAILVAHIFSSYCFVLNS
jgi:hypothetical protein